MAKRARRFYNNIISIQKRVLRSLQHRKKELDTLKTYVDCKISDQGFKSWKSRTPKEKSKKKA